MSARHAVVTGASIAGLSAAYWLRRTGWEVTVVERADAFREGGQNVDVRGVARDVLDRMGLVGAIKEQNTTETGTVFVDADGEVVAALPTDDPDGATAELEVLRGDFAATIRDALPDGVDLVFGDTVDTVAEGTDGVSVVTASGRTLAADLLVVAEGVRSATRDRLFGAEVDPHELGVTMIFGTIPRIPSDDDRWRWYTTTGGRQVHLRPDNHGTTRALLACTDEDDLAALDRDELLDRLRERYAGAGWQTERVLDGFAGSDDVYADHLTQIRMPRWHRGRVVLVGDAAWCVTPMGGGGSSLALTGGYVLAAYLSTAGSDVAAALDRYEAWMRPLVDDVQSLPPGITAMAYPQTRLGVALRDLAGKVVTSAPVAPLAAKLTQVAGTDQELPELAEPAEPAG